MIISYQGGECFKISQGDLTLAVNPNKKMSADITLFSTVSTDASSGTSALALGAMADKAGFVIDGPGEYEIKDIFVKGFLSKARDSINTIYMISFEGLNLCFLGALADPQIPAETLESLENIDILFVPVGGKEVLDPAVAYKLAVSLEPSIIIPMHYDGTTLAQFIKEGGEKVEPLDKFVVKKKDLEGKEGEIILLKEE
ncbi:MAG: hypothetical protein EXS69_00055 [Candidatus Zambryskibacteria bacterium]|nr:hypothetical protein [Candidatus Zambryskibacteria bacterium]